MKVSILDLISFSKISSLDILLVFLILSFLFLAFRELLAWYFKINQVVALLEKIEQNTRKGSPIEVLEEKDDKIPSSKDLSLKANQLYTVLAFFLASIIITFVLVSTGK